MNTIFSKEDFKLCDVPVPLGYLQSQTHAGIGIFKDKYILTTSPYPHPKYSRLNIYCKSILNKITKGKVNLLYRGEDYENPCVYMASTNDKYPHKFELLIGSPLMNKPFNNYGLRSYCSDPDLYIEDDYVYVLNRTTIECPDKSFETRVYLVESEIRGERIDVRRIDMLFKETEVSPCITKYRGYYYYFALDSLSYCDGSPCNSLILRVGNTIRNYGEKKYIRIEKGEYEPWHMSVFHYDNKLYAIVACIKGKEPQRCYQMLGVFDDDMTSLYIYKKPLTDLMSYRGSAIVDRGGEFILYSTTVNESFDNANSVDGRNVIMAHCKMEELLKLMSNG